MGYNASRATGVNDTGSTTSSSASSFELDIPTINSNEGYRIGTAYYIDTSGVPKVIHGVDLTSNPGSTEFWERDYGQAPDPALNLPYATFLTYDDLGQLIVPEFSTLATRQLIRGFAALQPYDPASPMTSAQPYSSDPVVGDPVTFSVQVHDYSLMDSPSVPVDFYAVPVDANGLDVTGPPEPIGTVASGKIASQGEVTVNAPPWTAKDDAADGAAQNWRIFVVLDPDNTVGEIHPWKDGTTCPVSALDPNAPPSTIVDGKMVDPMTGGPDTLTCGQNNQGYGTVTVMPATKSATNGGGTGLGAPQTTGVRVDGGGLSDGTTSASQLEATDATPSLRLAENATGIVHTDTTATSDAIQPVLIYDGPPSDGRLIAATTLDGASKDGGGDAQFTWRPTTPGIHTIYEELIGSDPAGDSQQTLQVNVVAPTTTPPPPPPVAYHACAVAGSDQLYNDAIYPTSAAHPAICHDGRVLESWSGVTSSAGTYHACVTAGADQVYGDAIYPTSAAHPAICYDGRTLESWAAAPGPGPGKYYTCVVPDTDRMYWGSIWPLSKAHPGVCYDHRIPEQWQGDTS